MKEQEDSGISVTWVVDSSANDHVIKRIHIFTKSIEFKKLSLVCNVQQVRKMLAYEVGSVYFMFEHKDITVVLFTNIYYLQILTINLYLRIVMFFLM